MKAESVLRGLAYAAAFMVPGLALCVPSGYSYGAALLLLAALASAPAWWRRPAPRTAWWLTAAPGFVVVLVVLSADRISKAIGRTDS